jgi:type IV pilus assembly protein PilA
MSHRIRRALDEHEAGFTLIELLVVIIIIGILAAIAVPVFLAQRSKGYDAQAKADARDTATMEEAYNYDNNYYLPAASFVAGAVPAGLVAEGLNVSPSDTGIVVAAYTGAKVAVTSTPYTAAIGGYCIQATSQSGKVFWYDSFQGGFVSFNCITSTP